MKRDDIRFFDPKTEPDIVARGLPHWTQSGVVTFVTWHLADSLPANVLPALMHEIELQLQSESIQQAEHQDTPHITLSAGKRAQLNWKRFAVRDKFFDCGYGACPLAQRPLAEIVIQSLRHFDGDRYCLTDAVVMPNHVHFLCAFAGKSDMLRQCADWKRYTANRINRRLNRSGTFWQVDQFDHLVRNPDWFQHYRRYIANNHGQAGLEKGDWNYYQKDLA